MCQKNGVSRPLAYGVFKSAKTENRAGMISFVNDCCGRGSMSDSLSDAAPSLSAASDMDRPFWGASNGCVSPIFCIGLGGSGNCCCC